MRLERKPLTAAQRRLAARYVPLARAVARPFQSAYPHLGDEFESAALLALVEAAGSFDPSKGVVFPTFVRLRIVGTLKDVRRASVLRGYRRRTVPSDPPRVDSLGSVDPLAFASEPSDGADSEAVDYCLSFLPDRAATILGLRFIEGFDVEDIAKAVGMSKSRTYAVVARSLETLRSNPKVMALT